MKQLITHRPGPHFAAPAPTCPECGQAMRIVSLEPHFSFSFLDVQKYQCECGACLSFSVARLD